MQCVPMPCALGISMKPYERIEGIGHARNYAVEGDSDFARMQAHVLRLFTERLLTGEEYWTVIVES